MKKYNINNEIIFYPTEKGWDRIVELITDKYSLTPERVLAWIEGHKAGEGYKEQLWVIIQDFHEMFYNGQKYFKESNFYLVKDVENSNHHGQK